MSLIGNVLKPLAKSILIPLRLTDSASETDSAIHKKIFGSCNTTVIMSNEEINEVMKIVKSLEESGSLKKAFTKKIKNEVNRQKGEFLVIRYIRCYFIRTFINK